MSKKPEKVFRVGSVSASIFANDVETDSGKRTIRSVNVQRRYSDNGEAKYTSSFGIAEIPQAMRVLELAQSHIEAEEAELALD